MKKGSSSSRCPHRGSNSNMEELQCNFVAVRRSRPKVLRLNLACSTEETHPAPAAPPPQPGPSAQNGVEEERVSVRGPAVTPSCSPDSKTPSGSTNDAGASSSVSSLDPGASPLAASSEAGICISLKKEETEDVGASSVPSSEPGISPLCASEEAGTSKKEEESEDVETSSVSNSTNPETDSSLPETEAFDDSTGASSAASSGLGSTAPVCASETDNSPLKTEAANDNLQHAEIVDVLQLLTQHQPQSQPQPRSSLRQQYC